MRHIGWKISHRRPRRRCEHNIKMDITEDMKLIKLAQDRIQ
jgi:hypothetical protein